jgi:hypothetical protein
MNKELKAISLLHPNIFNGDDLDLDEFINSSNKTKTQLLSNKNFALNYLKLATHGETYIEADYKSQTFAFSSDEILADEDIILAISNSDPVFFKHINSSLITLEVLVNSIKFLEYRASNQGYGEHMDCYSNFSKYLSNNQSLNDVALIDGLDNIYGSSKPEGSGTPLWVKIIDLCGQAIFNDHESFKKILMIFIKGQCGDYEHDYEMQNYEFWNGETVSFWTEYIDLSRFQKKISDSSVLLQDDIQTLLCFLGFVLENQFSEYFALDEIPEKDKLDTLIDFLKSDHNNLAPQNSKKCIIQLLNLNIQENDFVHAFASEELQEDPDIIEAANKL